MTDRPTIGVARTEAEVEALRTLWESSGSANVDSDLDYFMTVVRTSEAVISPFVVTVSRPGRQPTLIAARLTKRHYGRASGRWSFGARTIVVAFDGVMGAVSRDELRDAIAALRQLMTKEHIPAAIVQQVAMGSPLFSVLDELSTTSRFSDASEPNWFTELPASWEVYLGSLSGSRRKRMRYEATRLQRKYGDRLRLVRFEDVGTIDALYADMVTVARQTYQAGLGVSVADSAVTEALIRFAADRGWLRLAIVYIGGKPVAFWWGVAYRGTLSVGTPGFDPSYGSDRVGAYALMHLLQDAAGDPETHRLDFGSGDAEYKARLGTHREDLADVFIFTRHPRAQLLRAMVWTRRRGVAALKAGLRRTGLDQRARRWRRGARQPSLSSEA